MQRRPGTSVTDPLDGPCLEAELPLVDSAPWVTRMDTYVSTGDYSLGVARPPNYRELVIRAEKDDHGLASQHGSAHL